MQQQTKISWSQVKARLKDWDKAQLLSLVQDLYKAFPDNRSFLAARLLTETMGENALVPYLKRIHAAFYKRSGWPQQPLNLKDGRAAIRDYRKATGDIEGTVELMLTYVETGTGFTLEFGDIDVPFYNSLESVLGEAIHLLHEEGGWRLYERVEGRLADLVNRAYGHIGWGYGENVADMVHDLQEQYRNRETP